MICEHKTILPTRRILTNGTVIVFLQCQNCGCGRAGKLSEHKVDSLPEYDSELPERYRKLAHEEYQRTQIRRIWEQENKMGQWWENYTAYLKSEHWKQVRRRVIARDVVCQVCFHLSSSQAHHISYSSFSKYGMSFAIECVGVCESCHDKLHKKDKP